MMDAAEKYYINGKPRHISDPSTSVFKILTKDEFEDMEDKEIQSILLHQHILVIGGKKPKYGFDLDGLETLAPLDKPIIIHGEHLARCFLMSASHPCIPWSDLSIPVEDDYNVRHTSGTLLDMYTTSQLADGKSLNSLDFPMQCAEHPPQSFASDVKAWTQTFKNSNKSYQYPTTSTRWGLAATSGAYHKWHIDTDGFGTYVDPKTGNKVWFVARPKDMGSFSLFADRNLFYTDYTMESPNTHLWDIEFVFMEPGTRL